MPTLELIANRLRCHLDKLVAGTINKWDREHLITRAVHAAFHEEGIRCKVEEFHVSYVAKRGRTFFYCSHFAEDLKRIPVSSARNAHAKYLANRHRVVLRITLTQGEECQKFTVIPNLPT